MDAETIFIDINNSFIETSLNFKFTVYILIKPYLII